MKLKLDENLSRHLKAKLEALGHDVMTVEDEGLLGEPDTLIGAPLRTQKTGCSSLSTWGLQTSGVFSPAHTPALFFFDLPQWGRWQ